MPELDIKIIEYIICPKWDFEDVIDECVDCEHFRYRTVNNKIMCDYEEE